MTVSTAAPEIGHGSLDVVDAWWRAANYLTAGQFYLQDNPLLERHLSDEDIKRRPVGHWGTAPALNLVYAHLNAAITRRHLDALFVAGPGHGGAALLANAWLDHTYSERFPDVPADASGMRRLFRQYSFPGGVPPHAGPGTPGSIQEGGESGYCLVHAFGAALDNPGLIVACVVGDGEAETSTMSASWQLGSILNPTGDGAVLPILNLNGFKAANPTVLARMPEQQLLALFRGHGWEPIQVTGGFGGEDPMGVHARMAVALDRALDAIEAIRRRGGEPRGVPRWPMIILRTPKGWTGPMTVDRRPMVNSSRSHGLPLTDVRNSAHRREELEAWLGSYRPSELFDRDGYPTARLAAIRPEGRRRMSANPISNAGEEPVRLVLPDLDASAEPRSGSAEPTRTLAGWLARVIRTNPRTFRLFGPDETASNHLDAVWGVTDTQWTGRILPTDEHLSHHGRVIELLNENLMQGLLEGYTLTGRHGVLASYEAFTHVVDAMFDQHAKWLESSAQVPWRHSLPSFTYLLTSHVWRPGDNGFTHQDPGFLNVVVNKGPGVVRVYLPPDANSLLVTAEHCLHTRDHVNVILAGKHATPNLLSIDEARAHGARGLSIWDWAGTESADGEPHVVVAAAGEVPTLEALAAVRLLADRIPDLRVRFVNIVDLMRLVDPDRHPHGMPDDDFDAVFTADRPVVFAFHGYPGLIHELTYRRTNHRNLHVRGFRERGATTTPFGMLAINDLDRYRLARDVIRNVPELETRYAAFSQELDDRRTDLIAATHRTGVDDEALNDWAWLAEARERRSRDLRPSPAQAAVPTLDSWTIPRPQRSNSSAR